MHAWVVTSYPEALAVLMNCSADRTPTEELLDRLELPVMKPFAEVMRRQMMFMDGAQHTRLRNICSAAFTPRRVEGLRAVIQSIAEELIDKVIASGQMDMIADFANPYPATVTARLLGLPAEDHRQLHAWVLDLAELLGNFQHNPRQGCRDRTKPRRIKELCRRQGTRAAPVSCGWPHLLADDGGG